MHETNPADSRLGNYKNKYYLLHIPRRDVLTGLFAVPWYAGEAALLASTRQKYMQII